MDNISKELRPILVTGAHTIGEMNAQASAIQSILDSGDVILVDDLQSAKDSFEIRAASLQAGKEEIEKRRGLNTLLRDEYPVEILNYSGNERAHKPKKPNTGIHIGSYKKHPKKSKPKY
jgi:hypothetical protein